MIPFLICALIAILIALVLYYIIVYLTSGMTNRHCYDFATYKTFTKEFDKNALLAESNNNYLISKNNTILTTSIVFGSYDDGKYIYLSDSGICFYKNNYMILDIFSYYRYLIWKSIYVRRLNKALCIGRIKGLFKG